MNRVVIAVVVLIVAGVLAWEFIPVRVLVWDGSFDLTVRVESRSPPRAVSCETVGRRDTADEIVAQLLPPELPRWSVVADPFDGKPLTVRVAVSGRQSPFGRELRRTQYRYLAVIATMSSGERVGQVVEIPDGRASRDVTVTFP